MPWTDDAIMVSVTQDTRRTLLLEVFTKMRGRCKLQVLLEGAKIPPLYPGCTLRLTQQDAGFGETPIAELHGATGGLENADTNVNGMTVLHALRKMLEAFLPLFEPARNVYKAASQMIPALRDEDSRWPLHYLTWEMEILSTLGHAGSLERCKSAFKHGETIYISPRTGRAASRAEAGAFLDQMIPVPGFFMGKEMASGPEIRQGHEMTTMLFHNFALKEAGIKQMPGERAQVLEMIDEISGNAIFRDGASGDFDEDAYRRRLLSMRKLKVAERSTGM